MKPVFKLPELPFAPKDLEGLMSKETLRYHYEKHHAGYVEKANGLIDSSLSSLHTGAIIQRAEGSLKDQVSQIWNHTFLWHSLTRPSAHKLSEMKPLKARIEHSFDTLAKCKNEFVEKGTQHFGSGWIFLASPNPESLNIEWITLHDGDSPFDQKWQPLVCTDLWEHAYYIDYRNDRKKFLQASFDHLNWEFAAENLARHSPPHFDAEIRAGKQAA